MELSKTILILMLLSDKYLHILCFVDPFTATISSLVLAGVYYYGNKNKHEIADYASTAIKRTGQFIGIFEGCQDYWIPKNMRGLEADLSENLIGQPLAVEMIFSTIENHFRNDNSQQALVLSFHGDPGVGKNYASLMIIKNVFRNGKDSEYVHFFRSSIDFPSNDKRNIEKYKANIVKVIKDKIYECHKSIFIFDEVDKMPPGILDVLVGLIKTGKVGYYDTRRAVFILISNIGTHFLHEEALKYHIYDVDRSELDIKDLNKGLYMSAFNAEGGLQKSKLITSNLITYFIPFLPLTQEHVKQFLEKELKRRRLLVSEILLEQVLQELKYTTEDKIFVAGGCKNVIEQANYFIERQKRRSSRAN